MPRSVPHPFLTRQNTESHGASLRSQEILYPREQSLCTFKNIPEWASAGAERLREIRERFREFFYRPSVFEPREHQLDCFVKIGEAVARGVNRQVIEAPPAFGKSAIVGGLASIFGERTLVVCPSIDPILKIEREIKAFCGGLHVGCYHGTEKVEGRNVTLTTFDQFRLSRLAGRLDLTAYPLILFDDGDELLGEVTGKVGDSLPNETLAISLSATTYRSSHENLATRFGPTVYELDRFSAIEDGIIAGIHNILVETGIELPPRVITGSEADGLDSAAFENTVNIQAFHEAVIEFLKRTLPGRQVIAFVGGVTLAKALADLATESGIPAARVSEEEDPQERRATYDRYEKGEIQLITSRFVAAQALHLKGVEAIVNIAPTSALRFAIQRALRGAASRAEYIEVYDFVYDGLNKFHYYAADVLPNFGALRRMRPEEDARFRRRVEEVEKKPLPGKFKITANPKNVFEKMTQRHLIHGVAAPAPDWISIETLAAKLGSLPPTLLHLAVAEKASSDSEEANLKLCFDNSRLSYFLSPHAVARVRKVLDPLELAPVFAADAEAAKINLAGIYQAMADVKRRVVEIRQALKNSSLFLRFAHSAITEKLDAAAADVVDETIRFKSFSKLDASDPRASLTKKLNSLAEQCQTGRAALDREDPQEAAQIFERGYNSLSFDLIRCAERFARYLRDQADSIDLAGAPRIPGRAIRTDDTPSALVEEFCAHLTALRERAADLVRGLDPIINASATALCAGSGVDAEQVARDTSRAIETAIHRTALSNSSLCLVIARSILPVSSQRKRAFQAEIVREVCGDLLSLEKGGEKVLDPEIFARHVRRVPAFECSTQWGRVFQSELERLTSVSRELWLARMKSEVIHFPNVELTSLCNKATHTSGSALHALGKYASVCAENRSYSLGEAIRACLPSEFELAQLSKSEQALLSDSLTKTITSLSERYFLGQNQFDAARTIYDEMVKSLVRNPQAINLNKMLSQATCRNILIGTLYGVLVQEYRTKENTLNLSTVVYAAQSQGLTPTFATEELTPTNSHDDSDRRTSENADSVPPPSAEHPTLDIAAPVSTAQKAALIPVEQIYSGALVKQPVHAIISSLPEALPSFALLKPAQQRSIAERFSNNELGVTDIIHATAAAAVLPATGLDFIREEVVKSTSGAAAQRDQDSAGESSEPAQYDAAKILELASSFKVPVELLHLALELSPKARNHVELAPAVTLLARMAIPEADRDFKHFLSPPSIFKRGITSGDIARLSEEANELLFLREQVAESFGIRLSFQALTKLILKYGSVHDIEQKLLSRLEPSARRGISPHEDERAFEFIEWLRDTIEERVVLEGFPPRERYSFGKDPDGTLTMRVVTQKSQKRP